jgi:putative spermidine/putrescine transport system permease protein
VSSDERTPPPADPAPVSLAEPEPGTARPKRSLLSTTLARPSLLLIPFLGYLTVFLLIPTVTVVIGAFQEDGRFSTVNIEALFSAAALRTLWNSIVLSGSTAVIGAVFGALLAYLIVTAPATSVLRRAVMSVAGVLAQFGGVTLAFAFIATLGFSGVLTELLRSTAGIDIFGTGWLFGLPGLILVYTYFQIPLMVIVFIPALEGLRPQWREAAVSIGANTRQYWLHVAIPLLTPAFLGSMLLLFANAFAAYATAAALVSQGNPIVPLLIRAGLTSEVLLGRANLAFALAFEMIVVVALVMTAYALLVRRTSRWLR